MDDMNAFERQVARRFQHHAGPSRPVDDAAIFTVITSSRSPKWRYQSMFSATKLVVAGAILALFGGVLLIGQPLSEPEAGVPGAVTDDPSMAVSWFEVDGDDTGWPELATETDEGFLLVEHVQFGNVFVPAEPRFDGDLIHTYNRLEIDDETQISVHNYVIGNDGGRWVGTGTIVNGHGTVVLDGVDGYEGLSAVWRLKPGSEPMEAMIFPGDAPAVPVSWCQLAGDDYSAATARAEGEQLDWARDATRLLCPGVDIPE